MLHQVNSFLAPDIMVSLYYAFIYPYLSYCCSVWGNNNRYRLCSLQSAQNRAVKAIFLLPRLYSVSDLYNDTGIAPLDRIVSHIISVCMMYAKLHKVTNDYEQLKKRSWNK